VSQPWEIIRAGSVVERNHEQQHIAYHIKKATTFSDTRAIFFNFMCNYLLTLSVKIPILVIERGVTMTKAEEIKWLKDMLRCFNRKKATPGNGFIKARLAEKLAELEGDC
jgi:hypothetical protein